MVRRLSYVLKYIIVSTLVQGMRSFKRSSGTRLGLDLTRKIQEQVSQRQGHFIQQILKESKAGFFPQCQYSGSTSSMDCSNPLDTTEEDVNTSATTECSSEEKNSMHEKAKDKAKEKRRRNELSASSDDKKPPKRKSPNYFVAVQITDPQIHSSAKSMQEGVLLASDVDISSTRIEPIKFHITIMVMHLADKEAVNRAEEALQELGPILHEKLGDQQVTLEFKGLSVFGGGRVVFSPPKPSKGLDQLNVIAETVLSHMRENGVESTDNKDKVFHPHLTLFKFKDSKELFKKGIRKIKEDLYKDFVDDYLGKQAISSLQLCSMGEEKQEDGYYLVKKEVSWLSSPPN